MGKHRRQRKRHDRRGPGLGAAPMAALALAGATAVPSAGASVDLQRTALQARVAAVRASLSAPAGAEGVASPRIAQAAGEAPVACRVVAQATWTNWPKWSKWSNWANK